MEPNNELIKVEEITSIMHGAPDVIATNQNSVAKCKEVGQALLDTVQGNGSINSDELDKQVSAYLEKTKTTLKIINERRTPITQLLTRVSKVFTTLENDIDITKGNTIPNQLQQYRNKYAAKKLAEKQRQEEEARRKLAIKNEKVYFKTEYKKELYTFFHSFLNSKLEALQLVFNSMSIENFDTNKSIIVNYLEIFDPNTLITNYIEKINTTCLSGVDKISIRQTVVQEVSQEFTSEYISRIRVRKAELKDLFNSKYIELKSLEDAKKNDLAKFDSLQAEKAERERQEREKIAQEEADRQRKQQEELERQKQAETMNNLFTSASIVNSAVQPKVKVSKKVEILTPAGFIQVYQLWMEREGMFLSNEELTKLHKKMIAYIEKIANGKDEELINSEYINYVDEVKAK